MHLNLGGLPVDVRMCEHAQPCAGNLMDEAAADQILDSGIMPLASLKDTGEVQLLRVQLVAFPAAALAG